MASTGEALFSAIEADDVDRVRELLDERPELASARDPEGVSALMRARYRRNMAVTEAIHSRVPQLDVFEAASFGDLDALDAELDREHSLATARSGDGFTALHFAAFFGTEEAAALLLGRGAEVDAIGTGWMRGTALHSAASASHVGTARRLLDAGADPNSRQSGGFTPLHAAAHNGDAELVRLLLDHGADPDAAADDGASVRDQAAQSGDAATIALLPIAREGDDDPV